MNLFAKKILSLAAILLSAMAFFIFTFPHKWTDTFFQKNFLTFKSDWKINYPQESLSTPFNPDFSIYQPQIPNRNCNIANYGAVGNGKTDNTQVFWKAINDCAQKGGGHVVVPKGVFLSGPIELLSNIDLHLEKDSKILFTTDFSAYLPLVFSRFEGVEYYNFSPPIYARNAQNISITGKGTLDGQGRAWWDLDVHSGSISDLYKMGKKDVPVENRIFGDAKFGLRPTFVEFVNCHIAKISEITLINGPMWTVHPLYSQDITVDGINIQTQKGPSTDGVAIDSSRNILIQNSTFATGDDAIVIKSGRDNDGRRVNKPSENIIAKDCIIAESHGAIAIGSEISADAKNIWVKNIAIDESQYAFRIKSNSQRGGTVENVWIDNISANGLRKAIVQINTDYEKRASSDQGFYPVFRNINIQNILCKDTADAINIIGMPKSVIEKILIENISVGKSRDGVSVENSNGLKLKNISLNNKYNADFNFANTQNTFLENPICKKENETCVFLSGKNTRNIHLLGERKNFPPEKIQLGSKIDKNQISIDIQ